jgi:hypothetical protein
MPPKLKTEIVERSMFIFLPNRLLLLLNSSIPSKTFFSQRAFFSTLLGFSSALTAGASLFILNGYIRIARRN